MSGNKRSRNKRSGVNNKRINKTIRICRNSQPRRNIVVSSDSDSSSSPPSTAPTSLDMIAIPAQPNLTIRSNDALPQDVDQLDLVLGIENTDDSSDDATDNEETQAKDPFVFKRKNSGFGNNRKTGYKGSKDWEFINKRLKDDAKSRLEAGKRSNNPAEMEAAQAMLRSYEAPKLVEKDHSCELIWCKFREFIFSNCGRTLPPLYLSPPTVNDMILFFQFHFRPERAEIWVTPNGSSGTRKKVNCKGLSAASFDKYREGLEFALKKCGWPDVFFGDFVDLQFRKLLDELRMKISDKYAKPVIRAPRFVLWSDFDKLYQKLLVEDGSMKYFRAWTIHLTMFALFLRRKDVCHLTVEGLSCLLDSTLKPIVDEDGLPRVLTVFLPRSKSDGRASSIGGQTFHLMRNYRDIKLCPVNALISWLSIAGISKGPIFPHFVSGSNKKFGQTALAPKDVSAILSDAYRFTFGRDTLYKTHSPRRTAAMWARMCGASDSEIQQSGRWKSNVFLLYVGPGRVLNLKTIISGEELVCKRWMFHPIRFTE